jgi:GTP-binding protein HflX
MLAAVKRPSQRRADVEESLEELAGLAAAAGATVGERVVQERQAATPSLYFGRGKVEEMAAAARAGGMNLFISDDALTPIQERNLTEALGIHVIDRTALRGQAAGGARAADVPPAASGRAVEAPRAPGRRHRNPGSR